MGPKTVDAPEAMRALFAEAERVVGAYFSRKTEQPEQGTIEIAGERYVLLRAASLSVEFFRVVRDLYGEGRSHEADGFARDILFDLAHAVGRSDAQSFATLVGAVDPMERLSAGPVHFAHSGWAKVQIAPESTASPDEHYYLLYDHPYSFESDAWIRAGIAADFPVCIMSAGYSAGWCSASFGIELLAAEIECRARGDAHCRFVMAPPHRIEERVAATARGGAGAHGVPGLFARKRLEDRLRAAKDELEDRVRERTAELERANARLVHEMEQRQSVERQLRQSQKMEAIGRLAGGIAHDFNNVLAVILGYTSVLERRAAPGDDRLRDGLTEIGRAARQAGELTQQLLALSRAQIQRSEDLDLSAVVAEMGTLLTRLVGDHIRVRSDLGRGVPPIWGNASSLQQVVLNLVVNARDAMPDGGTLALSTRAETLAAGNAEGLPPGEYAVLEVQDSGVGMDEETRDRIFDPFFTTKPSGQGSGLGLSTVYGIVSQSGGAITVQTEVGRGSRFRVLLPAYTGERARRSAPPPPSAPPASRGRVLVVEDDARLRAVVRQMLELEGFAVSDAANGAEALAIVAHEGAPRVVVTDVMMPGGSGVVLAKDLRERHPRLRILFVSGHADVDELRRGIDDERMACLAKPFAADALVRAIEQLLATAPSDRSPDGT